MIIYVIFWTGLGILKTARDDLRHHFYSPRPTTPVVNQRPPVSENSGTTWTDLEMFSWSFLAQKNPPNISHIQIWLEFLAQFLGLTSKTSKITITHLSNDENAETPVDLVHNSQFAIFELHGNTAVQWPKKKRD